MAHEMDWLQPQKNGLSMVLHVVPERDWYGAWNGAGYSPKMHSQWCLQWRLNSAAEAPKNGAWMAAYNGVFLKELRQPFGSPQATIV